MHTDIFMRYVVAGNYDQFKKWLRETNRSPSEYAYVSCVQNLIGLSEIEGYFVGTWQQRKDLQHIIEYIRAIKKTPISDSIFKEIPQYIMDSWI